METIYGKFILFLFMGTLALGGLIAYFLYDSVPRNNKPVALTGLTAKVTIEEDRFGVPTIKAQNLLDLLRAQGWVTARQRLFQMDLIRRRTSGRLAEILGSALVSGDKVRRRYGFPQVAKQAVAAMSNETRIRLEAYSDGVNQFISQGNLPFEMRVLHYQPYSWTPEDTVNVVLSMFDPNDDIPNESEHELTRLNAKYPPALMEFLTQEQGFLDSPLIADRSGSRRPTALPALRPPSKGASWLPDLPEKAIPGSNAWAVSRSLSASKAGLLAADPHLHLDVPNIWFRLRLESPEVHVTGVSLPGIPLVLIGTNGNIAWSFTNGMADVMDSVPLPKPVPVTEYEETIHVRGGDDVIVKGKKTEWGPVIEVPGRQPFAVQWTALDAEKLVKPDTLSLCQAKSVKEAITALSEWGGPIHNAIIAARNGEIGWTLVGNLPRRIGFDGRTTVQRDSTHRWDGYIPYSEMPRLMNPPEGILVSANQRSIPDSHRCARYANNWPSPARAYRLRNLLLKYKDWSVEAMQLLQTDIHSLVYLWYRDQLVQCTKEKKIEPSWRSLVESWDGEVSVDSTAYPFLKKVREQVFRELVFSQVEEEWRGNRELVEDLLKRDQTIVALSQSHYVGFCDAFVEAAEKASAAPLVRWGSLNHSRYRHPFSFFLPSFLAKFWNMPEIELRGDSLVPISNEPTHGASMRMLVDLSDPKKSRFAQPGGQSAHLLSKNYSDQFETWAKGEVTDFEPGSAVTVIEIAAR